MFYTRMGDDGETSILGTVGGLPKDSVLVEALGEVDELNSLLGVCRSMAIGRGLIIEKKNIEDIVFDIQQSLFVLQAELAGAEHKISARHINFLEQISEQIEKSLPPIKTFSISGDDKLGALFDLARAVARRVERRLVAFSKSGNLSSEALAFANRLSSVLYALARLSANLGGITEKSPEYK